ncbi:MAG: elongation factor G [Saprospiraceae bacterium]|nr:elongation factor G [Saprospiraceae bacterium]
MKVYQSNEIKNIALIGGAKSGKTTLAETMLFLGGVINRRGTIDDKNTVSDYREIELERENSVVSTLLYTEYNGKKINIIDTPGFDDFIGEVIASLKVADTAFMVVNAQNGVEVGTEITWRYTTKENMPVAFVINQLEHEKANFDETIRQLKTQFGDKVTIAQYPISTGLGFNSIVDVISMKLYKYPTGGGNPEILDIPDSEMGKVEELRETLIESAAESDEALMEIFFEEGTLNEEQMAKGLKLGLVNRDLFPVFCISAKQNMGVDRLMEFINSSVPLSSDLEKYITADGKEISPESKETTLFVFKTGQESHLGEIVYFKVLSGEVTEGMDLLNAKNGNKERIPQLLITAGKKREKVDKIVVGDIGATIKLKATKINETLNTPKAKGIIVKPMEFPEPKFRVAVKAKNSNDDEKLGAALNSYHRVDPTIVPGFSKELRQMIVEGQGELHLNILKWHLEKLEKVEVDYINPKIAYRETITRVAQATYMHKKQSGGSGQFGEVHMLIEPYIEGMPEPKNFRLKQTMRKSSVAPLVISKGDSEVTLNIRGKDEVDLDWGGKLIFYNCIVGGAIETRFLPAILKGIMERMEQGPLTGSYARDIRVAVYDGKMHSVDSNEISFKLAGRNAFSMAFKEAGPKILEPIFDVEVMVPEDMMGSVMTDLQGRRALIMGMDGEGNYQKIKARVPLAEMNKYSTTLSSLTSGRAMFTMKFNEYGQVPSDIQDKLLKAYEEEQDED